MDTENMIFVKPSKGKPLSLSCQLAGDSWFYMTISQKMIDENIAHPVPKDEFFLSRIGEGRPLTICEDKKAAKRWEKFMSKKQKEDTEREEGLKKERMTKLLKLKAKQDKRGAAVVEPDEDLEDEDVEIDQGDGTADGETADGDGEEKVEDAEEATETEETPVPEKPKAKKSGKKGESSKAKSKK